MSINYTATISINYTIPLLNLCPIIFGLMPVAGLFALMFLIYAHFFRTQLGSKTGAGYIMTNICTQLITFN